MSTEPPSSRVPEAVDAWRMVAARRGFEGRVALSALPRLQGLLYDSKGEASYALEFDRDALLQVSYVQLRIEADLPLLCQRSLERFLFPVRIEQRLGLVRDEAEESALPPDYEALLVPEDGQLHPLDLIEDELVLAVPVVPANPDAPDVQADWPAREEEVAKANPFAALATIKKN